MNRCISCQKMVTPPKAQNVVTWKGHQYLVCCPVCENEFNRDPEYYMTAAKTIFGEYGLKAYSQTSLFRNRKNSPQTISDPYDNIRILQNLLDGFEQINKSYKDMKDHFDDIADSGGIESLRSELQKHRNRVASMQNEMSADAGGCQL